MKLLHQNPPPALLTGHSPPSRQTTNPSLPAGQPRFGSLIALTPNSLSQFTTDTLGVWAPKVPITRSKTQFFEDAFLELVEDGAFYFTLPVVGPLLGVALAKASSGVQDWRKDEHLQTLAKHLELVDKGKVDARKLVGHPMRAISDKLGELVKSGTIPKPEADKILQRVVATKAGALIGTVGVAAGFEYMIQHTKNVITAKGFHTKNFAAVAGLEARKAHTQEGQTDPVEKAKKRGKQVASFVAGSLGAALAAPFVLKKVGLKGATDVLKVVDCAPGFDISKPILAMLIGTGVVSYLDAARDPLEKKETGTRLCIVAPYLLFGKELAGFGITKFVERFTKVVVGKNANGEEIKKAIKDIVPLTTGNPLKQMINPKHLLDFNVVKKDKDIVTNLQALEKAQKDGVKKLGFELTDEIKAQIISAHGKLNTYSYLLGALGCGLGMNWLIYKQTQARYKHQQEQAKQQALNNVASITPWQQPVQQLPQTAPAAFVGRPFTPQPTNANVWQTAQPWPTQSQAQPFAANNSPFFIPRPQQVAAQ